jgi:predicted RNase H-related nuclease YkuK (DUF458 family)
MIFRHGTTKLPVSDLQVYIQQQLMLRPDTKIYIGIDSKATVETCAYALVIAFRYSNNGVHYIYNKEYTAGPHSKWERLMNEIERLMNFTSWFKDNVPYTIHAVDVDVNECKQHYSNRLHAIAVGWGHSLGVKVITKPHEVIASKAADYIVNH